MNWLRFYHTLRYLKPIQIYGRLWFNSYNPAPDTSPPPPLRSPSGIWSPPARRQSSMLSANRFRFLNEEHTLEGESSWNNSAIEKLWVYNLHYFDDLNAQDASKRKSWHESIVHKWVEANPPAKGNGWESYPLSLRIVNWIKWFLSGNHASERLVASLAVQVRYLSKRIEWHLLGNHLFANAKALVFAGLFFKGAEAEHWMKKGLKILEREIPEQILEDGGHFELSPMYHSIILEDILDLYNLSRVYSGELSPHWAQFPETLGKCANKMRYWLKTMCHPDGEISFFNDAAVGIAPCPKELEAYALRLNLPATEDTKDGIVHLLHSGYIRLQREEAVVLLDVGRIGPDYLPGHAHADNLTFEVSLFNSRAIVNSGTSCYGNSPERLRQRSTPAHNTVTVNNKDSSEVWGGFRVARRAYPTDVKIEDFGKEGIKIIAAHDGYRRSPDKTIHQRTWHLTNRQMEVIDLLKGPSSNAVSRFHFHPKLSPSIASKLEEKITKKTLSFGQHNISWSSRDTKGKLEKGSFHPEFGLSMANFCLASELKGKSGTNSFTWG